MALKQGSISIDTENIFPIIKKWLYSDKDIFIRELISNGCDAVSKHKRLVALGETDGDDKPYKITVAVSKKNKTLSFSDNGIGMTADEIDKYINQVAFSGAEDFFNKYKDKMEESNDIIGHFGLGFYSAFMVSSNVEIDTLSFASGAKPIKWQSADGMQFEITEDGTRTERGTTIILTLAEDSEEFLDEYHLRSIIKKYCSFLPVEIYVENTDKLEEEAKKKESPLDFALWKKTKIDGEVSWSSPWGMGRPGWHIECSTMNKKILGETIDIHAGGEDLEFPHHENEIAQSETLTGKTFANYWLHNGMITVDGAQPGRYTHSIVSYLPDRAYLSDWMKVMDVIDFFSDFYRDFDRVKAIEMFKTLRISPLDRLKTLSKGTKEKVQLILTMSRRAQLYVLDEPIAGVDPAARDYILNTILANYSEDASVLLSTHLIADIERVLDEVVFLKDGEMVLHESVDTIREEHGKSVDMLFREVFAC